MLLKFFCIYYSYAVKNITTDFMSKVKTSKKGSYIKCFYIKKKKSNL